MANVRLGDDIDDYCVKCKRIMNHSVVSLMNDEPAKVRCRTCHSDHDYRHEQPPPPKTDARKAALFDEVLAKVAPDQTVVKADAAEPPAKAEKPKTKARKRWPPGTLGNDASICHEFRLPRPMPAKRAFR
jgi:hypothetical protein